MSIRFIAEHSYFFGRNVLDRETRRIGWIEMTWRDRRVRGIDKIN